MNLFKYYILIAPFFVFNDALAAAASSSVSVTNDNVKVSVDHRGLQYTDPVMRRWSIAEPESDYQNNEVYLFYELSDAVGKGQIAYGIYTDWRCSEGHNNIMDQAYIKTEVNDHEMEGNGDGSKRRDYVVKFVLRGSKVDQAPFYHETTDKDGNVTATLQLCSKIVLRDSDARTNPDAQDVNGLETLLTFHLNPEKHDEIIDVDILIKNTESEEDAEQHGFNVEAYECDEHDNEIISTVPKHRGEIIRLCVTPDYESFGHGVRMRSLETVSITHDVNFTQTIVSDGSDSISNGFANLKCEWGSAVCSIEALLRPDFFHDVQGTVHISGDATFVHFGLGPFDQQTLEPTNEPTVYHSPRPSASPSAIPTGTPTVYVTPAPTDKPTEEPTPGPTDKPTAEPTDKPTEEPTQSPTDKPTKEPTEPPTDKPTKEPKKKHDRRQLFDEELDYYYDQQGEQVQGEQAQLPQKPQKRRQLEMSKKIRDDHYSTFDFTFETTTKKKSNVQRDEILDGQTTIVQPRHHNKDKNHGTGFHWGGGGGTSSTTRSSEGGNTTPKKFFEGFSLSFDSLLSNTNFLIFIGVVVGLLACNFCAFLVWLCCCRKYKEEESRSLLVHDQNHHQIRQIV